MNFISLNLQKYRNLKTILESKISGLSKSDYRLYANAYLAISEVLLGLLKMSPNRNKIYFANDNSPILWKVKDLVSKSGGLTYAYNGEALDASKDLAIIEIMDHPITGEIFPILEKVEDKIYRLRINHSLHKKDLRKPNLNPYEIELQYYYDTLSIVHFGSRSKKIESLISFQEAHITNYQKYDFNFKSLDKNTLFNYLENLSKSSEFLEPFMDKNKSFVGDKLVFKVKDNKAEKICKDMLNTGIEAFTTSNCFWEHPFELAWSSDLQYDDLLVLHIVDYEKAMDFFKTRNLSN